MRACVHQGSSSNIMPSLLFLQWCLQVIPKDTQLLSCDLFQKWIIKEGTDQHKWKNGKETRSDYTGRDIWLELTWGLTDYGDAGTATTEEAPDLQPESLVEARLLTDRRKRWWGKEGWCLRRSDAGKMSSQKNSWRYLTISKGYKWEVDSDLKRNVIIGQGNYTTVRASLLKLPLISCFLINKHFLTL